MAQEQDLTGRVAVITGASSGIGEAAARRLRAAGMRLVLTGRREDRLAALAAELGEVEYLAGDITEAELPAALIRRALEAFGRCDAVLNNAGAFAAGPAEELEAERIRHMVRVNVEAAYAVALAAMKHFKSVGAGDLVNTSSIAGAKVSRGPISWYAGTKHAIEAITEGLRIEGAEAGVRVSCVEPGMTQTELFDEPITSISRPLDPEDIARSIQFILASPPHVSIPKVMILPSCQPI